MIAVVAVMREEEEMEDHEGEAVHDTALYSVGTQPAGLFVPQRQAKVNPGLGCRIMLQVKVLYFHACVKGRKHYL